MNPSLDEISEFAASASNEQNHRSEAISLTELAAPLAQMQEERQAGNISVNDYVEISRGEQIGLTGIVQDVSATTATVLLTINNAKVGFSLGLHMLMLD